MDMEYKDNSFYNVVRVVVGNLFKVFYRPKIVNSDLIPTTGRVILAGNHTSIFDCVLLMATTKRQIHFLAKKELLDGVKRVFFSRMGIIPVNRKIKDKSVIPTAKEYLKNGLVIGIFPEGTTEKGVPYLMPFKEGAVRLSYETDTYIVPFKISGRYKFFSKDLKIVFDKPLKASENIGLSNELLYNIVDNIKEVD